MRVLLVRLVSTMLAAALVGAVLPPKASADAARMRAMTSVALHPWHMESGAQSPLPMLRDPTLRERTFAELEALGVRQARVDFRWFDVEPNGDGISDQLRRDWSGFDAIVQSASAHGVELVPIVSYVPGWANGNAHYFTYPLQMAKFQNFFAAALARYPQIKAWEIWNEPNYELFARPHPSVSRFVDLLRAADSARKAVGSNAKLISGGLASVGEIDMFRFFDEMAQQGALNYIDGLGVHPYGTATPDRKGSLFLRMRELHERLVRLGKGDIKLWLTEYGAPNATRASGYAPPLDEEGQAARLRTAFALAASWPWVENLTWYDLTDDCANAADPECRLGLLRQDFTPKRAAAALKDLLNGGQLVRLNTQTTLRLTAGRKRHRAARVYRARGAVFTPEPDGGARTVTIRIKRLHAPGRASRLVRARIASAGRFDVRLRRLRPGRYRITARFPGTDRYSPSSATRSLTVRAPKKRRR
jgi:polysaccharide biosynthesis protein PslG